MNKIDESHPCFQKSAIQAGLLFNIVAPIRWIHFKIENNTIFLSVAFDREPLEQEREMMVDAAAEAGGHFAKNYSIAVDCFYTSKNIEAFSEDELGSLIYARNE